MNDAPDTMSVELLSDTTFSRGEGTAGAVDIEVDHDDLGLPVIRGKLLHGLLRDAWLTLREHFPELEQAAQHVLGAEAELAESAILRLGDAHLPDEVRAWAHYAVGREHDPLRPEQVLQTLTDVRRQTAQDRVTGAPEQTTLRASRVILRGLKFAAPVQWLKTPTAEDRQCLALCVLAVRHGGLQRNRGRGHLRLTLNGDLTGTRKLAGLKEQQP